MSSVLTLVLVVVCLVSGDQFELQLHSQPVQFPTASSLLLAVRQKRSPEDTTDYM